MDQPGQGPSQPGYNQLVRTTNTTNNKHSPHDFTPAGRDTALNPPSEGHDPEDEDHEDDVERER